MSKAKRWILILVLWLFIAASVFGADKVKDKALEFSWPKVTQESKPWTYWWWMGSAVDRQGLTENLETYHKAGIGGVHIIPIYGVKGYENRFIDYLSPQWMEMLKHTIRETNRLGMGVDMTTGTGWPFGGPQVGAEDAAAKVVFQIYTLDAGNRLSEKLRKDTLQSLIAYSEKDKIIDLTEKVDKNGVLDWIAPAGKWELYAVSQTATGQKVKRAAPGAEGNVLAPFSTTALKNYLNRFDKAFASYKGDSPRAYYHDSYEYYKANWTDDLFEQFKSRMGYDLRRHLPALFGRGSEDVVSRVKCDYRETISELLLERFTIPWVKWCHRKGSITRNQAHGSPGNLLDLYAAADISETEIFGPSGFEIPGLRVEPDFENAPPDVLMLKFSSSAAHITGKKLVSSESCTWLGEHFKVSLSQVKPEIDQLLASGVNHIFYHGMAYSPFDEPWPGWLFYASTNFGPSNSFWRDFPELNAYIARCQSILQSSKPANDILLYFPIYDVWQNEDGMLCPLQVHNIDKWLYGSGFHEAAKTLWGRGYTFDYVSDRLLAKAGVSADRIQMCDAEYRIVVVPQCSFMPLRTLEKLIGLAKAGGTIIVQGNLPEDVPGFGDLENRRELFRKTLSIIKPLDSGHSGISGANIGNGRFLIGGNLEQMLELTGIFRESVMDTTGIQFIRRAHSQGHHYFITNLGRRTLDDWVRLGVKAKSVVIFDPLTGKQGLAAMREGQAGVSQVYLQLQPGESCILRTFSSRKIDGPKRRYLQTSGQPYEIKGMWNVTFLEGGPKLPAGFETKTLTCWTQLGDAEAKRFAGTALYTISFEKPAGNVDDWVLDLGRVCESARIKINGRYVGALWSIPFQIPVGRFLREGKNMLEVEVTNLTANRIAEMDRRRVSWKKFYDINFVNIQYREFDASAWPPMDSGLLGPVCLIPSVSPF